MKNSFNNFYLIFSLLFMSYFSAFPHKILNFIPVKGGELRWAGGSLNKSFLQCIQQIFDVNIFIETGTYIGDSTEIASEIYESVHTIELSYQLYEKACQRFNNSPSVFLYYGDSGIILTKLLSSLETKAALWLDGHWSAGNTARGETNTPILNEISALKSSSVANNLIIIDDIRLFQKSFKELEDQTLVGYPDLNEVIELLLRVNPKYSCWVYGDTLLAFVDTDVEVAPIIQAMTISRLNMATDQALHDAEQIIIEASYTESVYLKELCQDFSNDGGYGLNRYYHFWYGLTMLKRNKSIAFHHLKAAVMAGCTRAQYYLE